MRLRRRSPANLKYAYAGLFCLQSSPDLTYYRRASPAWHPSPERAHSRLYAPRAEQDRASRASAGGQGRRRVALVLRQACGTGPDDHLDNLGVCSERSVLIQASVTDQLGGLRKRRCEMKATLAVPRRALDMVRSHAIGRPLAAGISSAGTPSRPGFPSRRIDLPQAPSSCSDREQGLRSSRAFSKLSRMSLIHGSAQILSSFQFHMLASSRSVFQPHSAHSTHLTSNFTHQSRIAVGL